MDFQGHQPANQGRGAPGGVAQHPEDRIAPADREMDDLDRDMEPSFPARVNITIEKPGNGSLLIQTVAQDGLFQIEEVSYFSKPDLAHAQTAEQDWVRQSLYAGPPFENLDEDLQTFLERYLEERGINAELANMIPDYIQVKEQKEYVRWLESKLDDCHLHVRSRVANTTGRRRQELCCRLNTEIFVAENCASKHVSAALRSILGLVHCIKAHWEIIISYPIFPHLCIIIETNSGPCVVCSSHSIENVELIQVVNTSSVEFAIVA